MVGSEEGQETQDREGHEEQGEDADVLESALEVEQRVAQQHSHEEDYRECVGHESVVADREDDKEGGQEEHLVIECNEGFFVLVMIVVVVLFLFLFLLLVVGQLRLELVLTVLPLPLAVIPVPRPLLFVIVKTVDQVVFLLPTFFLRSILVLSLFFVLLLVLLFLFLLLVRNVLETWVFDLLDDPVDGEPEVAEEDHEENDLNEQRAGVELLGEVDRGRESGEVGYSLVGGHEKRPDVSHVRYGISKFYTPK